MQVDVQRLGNGPIIWPNMDRRMGTNINGPSLIKVPDWITSPLGRYYLYFAHHDGRYIRLAFADDLIGPWQMHEPGVMPIEESLFQGHIASPDVHVDHKAQRIRMYFHGADKPTGQGGGQSTRLALSDDGLRFIERPEVLGEPYMRVVQHDDWHYAIAMPGIFYRSVDGLTGFEIGPTLFDANMRHSTLMVRNNRLLVFHSQVGDAPERILLSEIDLTADWRDWQTTSPEIILEPQFDYEGVGRELVASVRGLASEPMRELRDPAIFSEDSRNYLLYSVAGEHGIGIAEIRFI